MKPNGIFYLCADRAAVAETEALLKQLDAFACLFRDGLNCPNALFLDGGSAASLYAPSLNSHGTTPLRMCTQREKMNEMGREPL
jgi:uncharacterized protein YigE (DUF2233 family)